VPAEPAQFNSDPLSAATVVRPQIEALATRGHDGIPAQSCKGNPLRRSSYLRATGSRFQKYLGIYKSITRL